VQSTHRQTAKGTALSGFLAGRFPIYRASRCSTGRDEYARGLQSASIFLTNFAPLPSFSSRVDSTCHDCGLVECLSPSPCWTIGALSRTGWQKPRAPKGSIEPATAPTRNSHFLRHTRWCPYPFADTAAHNSARAGKIRLSIQLFENDADYYMICELRKSGTYDRCGRQVRCARHASSPNHHSMRRWQQTPCASPLFQRTYTKSGRGEGM
jgi:hypothetical protein